MKLTCHVRENYVNSVKRERAVLGSFIIPKQSPFSCKGGQSGGGVVVDLIRVIESQEFCRNKI